MPEILEPEPFGDIDEPIPEPEIEPEVEPEAEAEPEAEVKPEPEKPAQTVPIPVLQEERQRRQEVERQLAESNQRYDRLSERLDKLNELATPKEPEVDPAEDPIKWLSDQHSRINAGMDEIRQGQQRFQERLDQQAAIAQIANMEQTFRNAHADYDQAVAHWTQSVDGMLSPMGLNESQRITYIQNAMSQIATQAHRNGRNPAEALYESAKALGFKAGNGEAEPVEDDKMEKLAKAQSAAKSLSNTGGKPAKAITLDALDAMSDDEFGKATEGDNWRKLWES